MKSLRLIGMILLGLAAVSPRICASAEDSATEAGNAVPFLSEPFDPPDWARGGVAHQFSDPGSRVVRPWYFARAITAADLNGRTLRELSITRNWIFARAGNPFRRAWLHEYFAAEPWYRELPAMRDTLITPLDRENAAFVAGYEAAIPRGALRRHYAALFDRDAGSDTDRIEVELLRERLGIAGSEAGAAVSPLTNPGRLDSLLTIEDLNDFSRRDLSLMRNLVYARRHRPFQSPELDMFFARYDWYAADSTFTDDRLTPVDLRNINLIQSVEEELGGPVDRATGAFWFGGA